MVSFKDIAFVAGLGGLVFLVTRAGRDLAGALGNVELPNFGSVTDISLPEITLPEINFPELPEFEFPNLNPFDNSSSIAGETVPQGDDGTTVFIPEDNVVNPDGTVDGSPPLLNLPEEIKQSAEQILKANNLARRQSFEEPNITTELNQQFGGGGLSNIGGTVRETPLNSLSDVIDRFGVGATEANDILSRIRDNFDGFDFGSNTGSGIGSVFENPEINTEIPSMGEVSNSLFEGLSAQEIAQRLTGGNINNF